jgi:hypothetical protein
MHEADVARGNPAKMIGSTIFDKMALIESFIKTHFKRVG